MQAKIEQKNKAIELRKQGFSYSEILKQIPVAKSSLSLWLKSVKLAKSQKQRLTDKKLASALRGAKKRKDDRIRITQEIKTKAKKEVGSLSKRELWLIGVSLYWAEGAKEKNKSVGIKFSNSDPLMIKLFVKWLLDVCKISRKDIYFEIYLHECEKSRENEVIEYWKNVTDFPIEYFRKTRWKKNKIKTKRQNIGKKYFGLVNINVKRGTSLNRKIQGWTDGICKYCEIV